MNKMRKILALVAVATMVVSAMVGCGNNTTAGNNDTEVSTESNTESNTEAKDEVVDTTENAGDEVIDSTEEVTEETTENGTEGDVDNPVVEGDTVATTLYNVFKAEADNAADLTALAEKLSTNEVFGEVSMATMEVEPGFLNGFDNEIKGFNKGVMIAPMIGTIPYVSYVFETDAPDALIEELEVNHNLRWNICTAADEMLVKQYNNYVFFVMSPYTFEG